MKKFKITIIQKVESDQLDPDDASFFGTKWDEGDSIFTQEVEAPTEDLALDEFHAAIPIAVLDHFELEITEV